MYGDQGHLPDDITWLQDNVTINDRRLLANADIDLIAEVIDGNSDYLPEPVPMVESTVQDWAALGLTSETSWESPYTDMTLTWDGEAWVFPFAQDDGLSAGDGVTTLELRTSDRRGEVELTTTEVDHRPSDWVEQLTSDDTQASLAANGQPVTIIDSLVTEDTGGVILIHHTDFGHPVVMLTDVYVNEHGVTIVTHLSAAPEDFDEVYASFWDNVQANGDFYPLTWTPEEITAMNFN